MIENIVNELKDGIALLNFADNVGGLVKTFQERIKDTVKTYPIYPNPKKTNCSRADYLKFVPDSAFKSCIYFEEISTQIVSDNRRYYEKLSTVRLVGWFNLPKINKGLVSSEQLQHLIIDAIPETLQNINPASNISISIAAQPVKNAAIFNRYNYDETVRQYLIYPFDYFAIDLRISYNIARGCVDDVVLNIDPC